MSAHAELDDEVHRVLTLLWRLDHAIGKRSKRMEATVGVTFEQRAMIKLIGRFPGMTVGQLAVALHVHPGTVSTSLSRLERRGLLERRRDGRDARRVIVGLTERGRALDLPSAHTVEAAVSRTITAAGKPAVETTTRVLEQLVDALDEESEAATSPPRRARR